jgi:hypothetical protein
VLFYARIFERGADRSFAERSTFVREAGAWRYAAGELVPRAELPEDVDHPGRTESLIAPPPVHFSTFGGRALSSWPVATLTLRSALQLQSGRAMTKIGERVRKTAGILALGSLAAAGCTDRRPFDMAVVHSGVVHVGVEHPGGGTEGKVTVTVSPAEETGCYEVPDDLRFTANGVAATSVDLYENTTSYMARPCDGSYRAAVVATFTIADTTQPVAIDIAQGSDHAMMTVQPLARPPLTLTWDGTLGGGSQGGYSLAELVPQSGDPSEVANGVSCWKAWLCPPGSDANCATPVSVDVLTTPSSSGARLELSYGQGSPGMRSLWISGGTSSSALDCGAPPVSECSGFAACGAHSDNHGYLLGPYPFVLE